MTDKYRVYGEFMNIPKEIIAIGQAYNDARQEQVFEAFSTGGGVDYLAAGKDKIIAILSDYDGLGSPESLVEPAIVSFVLDEDWHKTLSFSFRSVLDAIDFMAGDWYYHEGA